jgi:sec-independent protein translocase protein TatA
MQMLHYYMLYQSSVEENANRQFRYNNPQKEGVTMLGLKEMIVVLILVLLLFGPGRIVKVAGEMGKGIKAFKDGLSEKDASDEENQEEEPPK